MSENVRIKIVDEMMGVGKTCAAINYINKTPQRKKFMFITPYLSEITRITQECPKKNFVQPQTYGNKTRKIDDIRTLVARGDNIATTHALFKSFDTGLLTMIKESGYTLIMDEVADIIKPLQVTRADISLLLKNYVDRDKDSGVLKWRDEKYAGRLSPYRDMVEVGSMYIDNTFTYAMQIFPIQAFKSFEDVYILTYLFDAQVQKYYFDLFGVEYQYIHVKGNNPSTFNFTLRKPKRAGVNLKDLIRVIENPKMNDIGDGTYSFSKAWYSKIEEDDVEKIKKNLNNFFRNRCRAKTGDLLWTTFKDYRELLKGQGYTSGFLSCTTRGTNEYKNRDSVAYMVNKFLHPAIKTYFLQHNIEVNEDRYALSEMIQFVWRSAIRDGKPINLYIPSRRMRELFLNWLEEIL